MIHLFHRFGAWEKTGEGMIVRAKKHLSKGQLLTSHEVDMSRAHIGKYVQLERKCKGCPKKQTKHENIIY